MSMASGSRIGPYQVIAPLGAGGMGEVYRARDTKLNRDVAIKVLPAAFAENPERMARFHREAQILAALNHPNVAQIFGIEGSALVMEYVPGLTLQCSMPLKQALDTARQIAQALECAHDKGIVHRDLKPANIKVTPDGMVKVLDFGLAKAIEESPVDTDETVTMDATHAGFILGTPAYMSPEQATGHPADRRADIWSFGVVLWEMLTGRKLFQGQSTTQTLSDVLVAKIDFGLLPPDTPAPIRELTKRCLDRNPKSRLQAIGEARIAIDKYLAHPEQIAASSAAEAPFSRRSVLRRTAFASAFAVLSMAAIALAILAWRAPPPAPLRPMLRLNVEVGGETVLARVSGNSQVALSPDGTRLAFTYRGADGKFRLGTRLLQQSAVFPLSNTEDATSPFFSPDGRWIGFFAKDQLKKVSVDGAIVSTICVVPNPRGASWGDDGNIVLAAGLGVPLSRVSSDGGTLEPLTEFKGSERTHRWPQVLPGSQYVLFTASTAVGNYDDADIDVLSLKTGERRTLQHGGFSARYVSTNLQAGALCRDCGHLIYLRQSTLFAAPFNLKRLAMTGPPVPILEDVGSSPVTGGDFAISDSGLFVYLPSRAASAGGTIAWLDSAGKQEALQAPTGRYSTPRISPDGERVAFAIGNPSGVDIWVRDLERNTLSRLTFLGGENRYPVWTPDGLNILFLSRDPKNPGLYWVRSDGSAEAQRLTDGKSEDVPFTFTPDGKRLAFHRFGANGSEIWTAPVEGDLAHPRLGKAELFLESPFVDLEPAISPDGHWLAYASNESGTPQVYVRPFPGPGGKWQISTGSGHFPVWSRSSHELFFEKLGDVGVMAAAFTFKRSPQGETFSASTPRIWSTVPLIDSDNYPNYDVAPDGKRIVAILAPEDAVSQKPLTHLTFLLNFFDELQRKAPGRN
jgi:serine/threonine-protein kinase